MRVTRQIAVENNVCRCVLNPASMESASLQTLVPALMAMVAQLVIYHAPLADGVETARTSVLV